MVSFATLGNEKHSNSETDDNKTSNLSSKNTEVKQYGKEISYDKDNNNDITKLVKVKILVPMEDRKNAKKIKIIAVLKGQIKSESIKNVQKEFDKTGKYTINRTFAFDRNTNMGPIQIGDRFHVCVVGEDLNLPEGSACEKKLIKHFN
ncbi:MAG: hypothetical protein AB7F53_00960 [Nitrososphaeraceae archaeon]